MNHQGVKRVQSNYTNKELNPCMEESRLSQKCLSDNSYDRNKCFIYFENYKQCKKFWGNLKLKERQTGTKLSPEEKDKLKEKKVIFLK